jgi:endonuclease YncB( thermonuclease family)
MDAQGSAYRCGQKAAQALDYRISEGVVTCEPKDRDRYGRIVAVCRAYGEDLSAWMAGLGWALAFHRYSTQIRAGRGIGRAPQGRDVERAVRAAVGVEGRSPMRCTRLAVATDLEQRGPNTFVDGGTAE